MLWIFLVCIIAILLFIRIIADVPYPWEPRKVKSSSTINHLALKECFDKLEDGGSLDLVMGEVNADVCGEESVLNSLKNALKKDVKIRLIHGPNIDKRKKTEKFLEILINNKEKVEVYRLNNRPTLHFRVRSKKGKPKEVYEEEPHPPLTDRGYRHVKSEKVAESYLKLFEELLANAN